MENDVITTFGGHLVNSNLTKCMSHVIFMGNRKGLCGGCEVTRIPTTTAKMEVSIRKFK